MGLAFRAIATEPLRAAVFAERLGHPLVTRLCEVAQTRPFRDGPALRARLRRDQTGRHPHDPETA
ncbi:MAG: hypothetical protein IPK07_19130 [Deltaproteobacteria bacterium]|nr:hypothetical protein [Deltaproteobacteria bacterium]